MLWTSLNSTPPPLTDFPSFYLAGAVPLEAVHDPLVIKAEGWRRLSSIDVRYYPPYLRPAIFALPLRLLAAMDYRSALPAFIVIQFLALAAALILIQRIYDLPSWTMLLGLAWSPSISIAMTGQDPNTMLCLFAACLALLASSRDALAGAVLGIGMYKFHIVLLLAAGLLVAGRRRAFASFSLVAGLVAAASMLVSPIEKYFDVLAHYKAYTIGFGLPEMVSLRASTAAVGWPAVYFILAPAILAICLYGFRVLPIEQAFALAALGSLVAGFYVNWYDGALALFACAAGVRSRNWIVVVLTIVMAFWWRLWSEPFRPLLALMLLLMWCAFAAQALRSTRRAKSSPAAG